MNEDTKNQLVSLNRKVDNYVDSRYSNLGGVIRNKISDYLKVGLSIEFNESKRAALDKSIIEIRSKLSRNPDSQITMERLQSEIDHYKELYELFASHSQYAVIDQSAKQVEAEAKYRIVRPASLPFEPESPNQKKLFILGFILGIVIGSGAILLIEILDNSYKKVEDVEESLNIKVLGTIPRMDLPFTSTFKTNIPVIAGAVIIFLLSGAIVYFKFFRG
jgi:uncharacterized protein involved in exopolysaccharide biosynthesis